MRCEFCNSTNTYIKDYKNIFNIKGKTIEFTSKRRFCKDCNNLVYDSELDNKTSEQAISLYNKEYGISKEQIIALRKKYDLSLDLFSKIIGCAKKTLISYEQGRSIPNDSYLIIIKSLINKPELIFNIIEANREQFTEKELNKLNNKLDTLDIFYETNDLNEYNGFSKFSLNKMYNVIVFFAKDVVLKTKLLKEMFYADFLNYKETGASITGLEYSKLPLGPVPEQFDTQLFKAMFDDYINYSVEYKNQYEYNYIESKKEFNKSLFTEDELNVLKKVKDKFKDYSSKEIVEYSHKEQAYKKTKELQKISYDYAFDIEFK